MLTNLFWVLLLGRAMALPAPLVGPDGPLWVGPLPPDEGNGEVYSPRSSVVVDPETGRVHIDKEDASGLRRTWDGRRWTVNGGRVDDSWPPRDSLNYELVDGELVAVTGLAGVRERYFYDASGQLLSIQWPDGSALRVEYGSRGRVESITGPGPERVRFDWGDSIQVKNLLGRSLDIQKVPAGGLGDEAWEVTDDLGRVARSWYETLDSGAEQLVAWRDPSGVTTRLDWSEGSLQVTTVGGPTWRVGLDEGTRVRSLKMPGGELWAWEYDGRSRLSRLTDPLGRVTRWERDDDGLVFGVVQGGRPTRFARDGSGRITSIVGTNGSETRLLRDSWGRVSSIQDSTGNSIRITRYRTGQPQSIVSRLGGRWSFSLDLLGRYQRVMDPTGRTVDIYRTGRGDVDRIFDRRFGEVLLRRSITGDLTQLEGIDGKTVGLVRNAVGDVQTVIRGDGSQIDIERDKRGNWSLIRLGEENVEIERDVLGRPLRVGTTEWEWTSSGQIGRIQNGTVDLTLKRFSDGHISELSTDGWQLKIDRDLLGNPVGWSGTDLAVEVTRSNGGWITSEMVDGRRIQVFRDSRGLVERINSPIGQWRWTRDASGRTLQSMGPQGLRVGIDRDLAGRFTLLRYPGGALVRRKYSQGVTHDEVLSTNGSVLLQRSVAWSLNGRPQWVQQGDTEREVWSYDPLGQLVALEADGSAWSWSLDAIRGPHSELVVLDAQGQISEAIPPAGPPAWGVAQNFLAVFRDSLGRMDKVRGDLGEAQIRYDALGRLGGVRLNEGEWSLQYDARGRIHRVTGPDGSIREVLWNTEPDKLGGVPLATGEQLSRRWLVGPTGVSAMESGGRSAGVVQLGDGFPLWIMDADGQTMPVSTTPTGFSDSAPTGLLGPFGTIQMFAGGPLIRSGESLDPISGHPLVGLQLWPWEARSLGHSFRSEWVDPGPWMPADSWADPIGLLMDLQVLNMGRAEHWTTMPTLQQAVGWLPESMDQNEPPLGPSPTDLPLQEDPITSAFLLSVLPGGNALSTDDPLRVILEDSIQVPALPPGIELEVLGFTLRHEGPWLAPPEGTK